jgi:hypothetical protein
MVKTSKDDTNLKGSMGLSGPTCGLHGEFMPPQGQTMLDPPFCTDYIIRAEYLHVQQCNGRWYLCYDGKQWYKLSNELVHGHIWMQPVDCDKEILMDGDSSDEEFPYSFKDCHVWIDPIFNLIKRYPEI